jgi:hypothetical protein
MAKATIQSTAPWLLAHAAPLALAACGGEEPDRSRTYKAGVEDVSRGGELIVTKQTPAVNVNLPTTRMTNVPADQAGAATATPTPADEADAATETATRTPSE